MASSERISQILPTVKCSDCGRDVLIRRLGDHLCTSQPPVPSLPIIPAMKDKFKPQMNHQPISPLQSPNSGFKYNHNQPYNNSNNTGGTVTPPYAMTKDRPLMKDVYTDDTYADDFYKSTSTVDLPRNNMNSPSSPVSFRNHNESNSELNTRYEGTRKQSLGNIYNQQKSSYSTPTSNSSGALDNLMADLMNSMNDDIHLSSSPIPTSTKHASNHCAVCHEEFDYRDVVKQAGQKCYHKTCFVCRLCSTPFDQRSTHHEYEGELYCERDFHVVKNRIMCGACDKTISPSTAPIKALGRFYHPGHIKCYHCLCPIDGTTGWKEYQGRVYCRSDFKSLFLPKCKSCLGTIEKNAVSAMDGKLKGKWHLECFGCHTCHRPFPDNTFYVFDDLPYCKRHYHQLNNSLCRECSEPIEGQCAQTNENWRFHPRCFGCTVCHHPIIDTYYMYDRRIYCETHIRQLQRQKNIRAEKRKTQFGQI